MKDQLNEVLKIIYDNAWHIITPQGVAIVFIDEHFIHIAIAKIDKENLLEYELDDFCIEDSFILSVPIKLSQESLHGIIKYLSGEDYKITEVYFKKNPEMFKLFYLNNGKNWE